MNPINELHKLGQSIWYDNIERKLLENGSLAKLIESDEIRGVTSNPSIFNNAISKSTDYDAALKPMAWAGWNSEQIFYQLAIEDIRMAADLFLPLYHSSNKRDGYVSLEVNPELANDTGGTISEVRKLWSRVNRPNLMVKIPATPEGIPAIKMAIAEGFNINVTLIFSLERYQEVINAYLSGLEERLMSGKSISSISSVASFFVSRLDTKIDSRLEKKIQAGEANPETASRLLGKAAIANARLAYQIFQESINSDRFNYLKEKGANIQRPLWASTSTKNPSYLDVIYINELIGPDTVNTVPPQTLAAFRDHGNVKNTIKEPVENSRNILSEIENFGISIIQVTQELEFEGVKAFKDAFVSLLSSIDSRRLSAIKELGAIQRIPDQIQKLKSMSFIERMEGIDPSLWVEDKAGRDEITKRLGWLQAPVQSQELIPELENLLAECQQEGLTNCLLIGMGGSSLAPEVLAKTFGVCERNGKPGLQIDIIDSTDPDQVRSAAKISPVQKTLYIISSKSGSTSEVDALLKYFYNKARKKVSEKAGLQFIAITDPGTSLEKLAIALGFRKVIHGNPDVGGRYSALTAFGLAPAAFSGIDLSLFLKQARWMMAQCLTDMPYERNPGLVLGAIIGQAANQGKDKLTIIADPEYSSFGSWLEQLIAESTGKEGKGIIPVDNEPIISPDVYDNDRLFIYLEGSGKLFQKVAGLLNQGHPVIRLNIPDEYYLAAEFYRWEIATAVACSILKTNAFDQPDVQDSKNRTIQKISYYQANGKLETTHPVWEDENFAVFMHPEIKINKNASIKVIVDHFLDQSDPGSYIAINAYLPRHSQTQRILQKIRAYLQNNTQKAVTLGFGPRFLHSTGQLHKGGPNIGKFIQITGSHTSDLKIPESSLTFGTLQSAQAQGDLEALLARDRKILRIHLKENSLQNLLNILLNE